MSIERISTILVESHDDLGGRVAHPVPHPLAAGPGPVHTRQIGLASGWSPMGGVV
jgi:hypothetical protein